ncbi:MAG: ribonuclease Y [Erysipelotrichaceae bacterium]
MEFLFIIFSVISGICIGVAVMLIFSRIGLNTDQAKGEALVKEAKIDADNIVRQAVLDGKQQAHELRLEAEKDIKEKKQEQSDIELKLSRREDTLNFRDENLTSKEKQLEDKANRAEQKLQNLEQTEKELNVKLEEKIIALERISNYSQSEAKAELFAEVESKTKNEMMAYIKEQEEEAKVKAADTSREIIAQAIERYSNDEVSDKTVSVVNLPSDEMKGRIIGREGRNIRAIEQATGVDLIIDDTPEVITISCFDPIRREVARIALETLVKDGRIQPGRIEEVVNRTKKEINDIMYKAGEKAVFELGIGKIDKELIRLIGRLKYRYSYGQNALQHSIEVAYFAGIMAAELGLKQAVAKRAGLLHDIGKAIDFEVDGSHVELGAKVCKKHGERAEVINAIESHHGDSEVTSAYSNLIIAADTLSAARPGARYESMQNYINRLEQLEEIANGFKGVDKSYAIQAGREIRVMVLPGELDDLGCHRVAREIREKIESDMTYPGQIKVTVIRETRAQDVAK